MVSVTRGMGGNHHLVTIPGWEGTVVPVGGMDMGRGVVQFLSAQSLVIPGSPVLTDRASLMPQGNNNIIISMQRWPTVFCHPPKQDMTSSTPPPLQDQHQSQRGG